MRISDWSSDVCSSDLLHLVRHQGRRDHENDQQNQHHVHQGRDIDFGHWAAAAAIATERHGCLSPEFDYDSALACGLADPRTGGEEVVQVMRKGRSEEHTSELQSLMRISYAVFCLKKKKTTNKHR